MTITRPPANRSKYPWAPYAIYNYCRELSPAQEKVDRKILLGKVQNAARDNRCKITSQKDRQEHISQKWNNMYIGLRKNLNRAKTVEPNFTLISAESFRAHALGSQPHFLAL
jgi:hypothetical protein